MKQVTTNEILTFNKILQMETNALAVAKASVNVIADDQLLTLAKSGISAAEARIVGLQTFINDNNIVHGEGVQ